MEAAMILSKTIKTIPVGHQSQSPLINQYLVNYRASIRTVQAITGRLTHFLRFIGKTLTKEIQDLDKNDIILITSEQVLLYKDEIQRTKKKYLAQYYLNDIKKFLCFHKISRSLLNSLESGNQPQVKIVQSFLKYLEDVKKFSQIHTYRKHLNLFFKFLSDRYKIDFHLEYEFSEIDLTHILEYEKYQRNRIERRQIKKIYAYSLLRTVSQFFRYLRKENLSDIQYQPPRFLHRDRARRNDYVETDDMKVMIESVFATTPDIRLAYRNVSIILILIITGCRSIEICNLKTQDLWHTDYTALFKSKKSKNRKLKMNKTVMDCINQYISLRDTFDPLDDTLFLKKNGHPICSREIYNIFYKINNFAFGKSKNPPVALRHTYITNACEAGYDLRKVAAAAGHKILSSTDWYRHKSPERLKKNTFSHDPTKRFEKEFNL